MTHAVPFVAAVAVLTAFAAGAPVQAQTPEIDALRARAEAGVAVAQYDLGVMYALGWGVPQDDDEAHMWLNLAAAQSSGANRERLVKARDGATESMTPEQLTEAQRRAREWTPTPEP